MTSLRFLFLLCVALTHNGEAANIVISGFLGKGSHFMNLIPVGRSLVQKGHNVTLLIHKDFESRASDPELNQLFNFEIIPNDDPEFSTKKYFDVIADIGFREAPTMWAFFKSFSEYSRVLTKTCDAVLGDEAMMRRFESLDAVVADMGWPCAALIKLHQMKHTNRSTMRMIFTAPTSPQIVMFDLSGTPFNAAYTPSIMSGLTSSMTFWERAHNTILANSLRFFALFSGLGFREILQKYDLSDHLYNLMYSLVEMTDLVLVSCDFAVESPFATSPSLIPVGGLTARPPSPLPADLEDFMQSSGKDGVVVFSLGTYFASFTTVRPDLLKAFLDAFSRIPQKVIIQLKVLPAYDLPANVKALPWLPQNDLLGHPKTRLFVYHGGNNGFYEAVYHGVPLVVIPFMADQLDAGVRAAARGFGTYLDKTEISADAVYAKVSQVLNDPKYGETARRLSAIMRDRPLPPADRAAFWIEHVIKHGGGYMRSPAIDLSFIQYHLLDVYAFLISVVVLILYVVYRFVRCCCSCCCGRQKGISVKNKTD